MIKLSFALLLLILVFGCKKKNEKYIITGNVVNPEKNCAVGQMSVSLWATKISNGTIQNQEYKIASLITDASGYFEFNFDKEVFSSLKLTFHHDEYYYKEMSVNLQNLTPGISYHVTATVHTKAFLKTEIKNVNSQYAVDELIYRLSLPYSDCSSCCSTLQLSFSGPSVDTSWVCPVYGDNKVFVNWIYSYLGNTQPHFDTLYIPAGDTMLHQIHY